MPAIGRLWPCDDDDEEEDDNFIDDGRGDANGECVEKLMTNLKQIIITRMMITTISFQR